MARRTTSSVALGGDVETVARRSAAHNLSSQAERRGQIDPNPRAAREGGSAGTRDDEFHLKRQAGIQNAGFESFLRTSIKHYCDLKWPHASARVSLFGMWTLRIMTPIANGTR